MSDFNSETLAGVNGSKPIRADKPAVELDVRVERGLSDRDAQRSLEDLFSGKQSVSANDGGNTANRGDATTRKSKPAAKPVEPSDDDDAGSEEQYQDTDLADEGGDSDDDDEGADQDLRSGRRAASDEDTSDDEDVGEGARDTSGGDNYEIGEADEHGAIAIKHAGREYRVPKPLVEGAMRQAKFTESMTELAVARDSLAAASKLLETEKEEFSVLAQPMQDLHNVRAAIRAAEDNEPDPTTATDIDFRMHDKRLRDLRRAETRLNDAITQARTELEGKKQSAQAELLAKGFEYIKKRVPDWGPKKGQDVVNFMREDFTDKEIASFTDPRIFVLANEAMAYRALKKSKPSVRNRIANAPPVVKPSGRANQVGADKSKAVTAMKTLKRTGSEAAAVKAMSALLQSSVRRGR